MFKHYLSGKQGHILLKPLWLKDINIRVKKEQLFRLTFSTINNSMAQSYKLNKNNYEICVNVMKGIVAQPENNEPQQLV